MSTVHYAILLTALAGGACSSREPSAGAACTTQVSEAAFSPATPHVLFERDVLPIFVASCGFSSCHGAASGSNNGIFLGSRTVPNDAMAIRAALVGQPSKAAPSLPYVMPLAPQTSFLMRKLHGDFCGVEECEGADCGERMPRGSSALEPAALSTVETWIAQGAAQH